MNTHSSNGRLTVKVYHIVDDASSGINVYRYQLQYNGVTVQ